MSKLGIIPGMSQDTFFSLQDQVPGAQDARMTAFNNYITAPLAQALMAATPLGTMANIGNALTSYNDTGDTSALQNFAGGMLGNALSTSSRSDAQSLGVVVGSVFGEVLVWLWWRMTVRGWEYLEFWQDQIGKLTPDGLPAVLAPVDARRLDTRRGGLRTNSLQVISLRVIALFGLGYLVAGVIGAMTLVVR